MFSLREITLKKGRTKDAIISSDFELAPRIIVSIRDHTVAVR